MCTLSSQVNEWGSMTGPLTLPELRSHKTPYSFIFSCKSWARILKCYRFLLHKVGAAGTPHFAEEKRKVQRVMISPRPHSGLAAEASGKTQVSSPITLCMLWFHPLCFPFDLLICSVAKSCLTLRTQELQPARFLCPWDFPGKNTGVGCHFLL